MGVTYLGIWKQPSSALAGVCISCNFFKGCAHSRNVWGTPYVVFALVGVSRTVRLARAHLLSLIRIFAAVYIRFIVTTGVNEQEQDETVA